MDYFHRYHYTTLYLTYGSYLILLIMSKVTSICAANGFWQFFASQGVVEALVAFVLATNFTRLSNSLSTNIITPLVSYALPQTLNNYFFVLRSGPAGPHYSSVALATQDGATILSYGQFCSDVFGFMILLVIFYILLRLLCRINLQ